jgi:hypothetical protein
MGDMAGRDRRTESVVMGERGYAGRLGTPRSGTTMVNWHNFLEATR